MYNCNIRMPEADDDVKKYFSFHKIVGLYRRNHRMCKYDKQLKDKE
jgi:hypothetical protein